MPENIVGESDELEMAEENPSIETLANLTDAEIGDLLGHPKAIETFKEACAQLQELKGKAREWADERIADMFQPDVSANRLKYLAEDAKIATKEGALNDARPSSVL
jgi:hypothetical protein